MFFSQSAQGEAMKNSLIVCSAVKKHFHLHGKRVDSEAMLVLNEAVRGIMDRAILASRKFKTIKAGEIKFAYRQITGLEV